MRLVAISDTHGHHEKLAALPDGDVLIHAGDFTCFGYYPRQYQNFGEWFLKQPHEHKIFIAGNHEVLFDQNRQKALGQFRKLKGWNDKTHYLQNAGVSINDMYFYGLPQTPTYGNMAFNVSTVEDRQTIFNAIPDITNVLISHGPRYGVLDRNAFNAPCGCEALRNKVKLLPNLKAHIFGHIHEGHGIEGHQPISVNAALCAGHDLHPYRVPWVIEVN